MSMKQPSSYAGFKRNGTCFVILVNSRVETAVRGVKRLLCRELVPNASPLPSFWRRSGSWEEKLSNLKPKEESARVSFGELQMYPLLLETQSANADLCLEN